jgi:hypothetical protein
MIVKFMLCWMISFTLVYIPMMKSAHAEMITTNQVVDNMMRAQDHLKIVSYMDREDVKAQMIKLGVAPEEAKMRLAGMSDAELRKVAGEIDNSTAGGDIGGILVLVLVIILIIYFAKRI